MGGLVWKNKDLEVSIGKNKKSFIVRVVPFWYEGFGLMFKSKKKAKPLLFNYNFSTKMSIFSLFIPFDFLAVWLDKENNLIEYRVVKPREDNIFPNKKFRKLIEIPITENYKSIVDFILKNNKMKILFRLD
jgi:uncharacterized membrane protein (UPF0127 family)